MEKNSNDEVGVLVEQEWNGKIYNFDPDSSPKAWEMYERYYDNFDFKKLKLKGHRLVSEVTVKNIDFEVAGDCSFNFNNKKKIIFEDIINKGNLSNKAKNDLLEQLEKCCAMHHTLNNFDLMPVTGGLNNLKGNLKYIKNKLVKVHLTGRYPTNGLLDRLDTFIYFLDYSMKQMEKLKEFQNIKIIGEFLSNSVFTMSMKSENFSELYEIMKNYPTIYMYCETFYNLKDKKFIDKLIESGRNPIENTKDVKNYMELANEFWNMKKIN